MFRLLAIFVVCGWTYASPSLRHRRQVNPCVLGLTDGHNYFAVPGNENQFIECDLSGHMTVLSCAGGLVWREQQLACVFKFGAQVGSIGTGGTGGTGGGANALGFPNPCTDAHLSSSELFFPYPGDDTKFIQCDLWGDVFVLSCPLNLHWNVKYETCTPLGYVPPSTTSA